MPSVSKAQQQAAGIAHAAEKGEIPKSKLRGASQQMFKSMKSGDLKKFAKTKHKNLPKHVESARQIFRRERLAEGRDDASSVLSKPQLDYARMSSADTMNQPGGIAPKVRKRFAMIRDTTNQHELTGGPSSKTFPSMDKVGPVRHAFKSGRSESMTSEQVVDKLLE